MSASRRKKKDQEPKATDQGDAYEPLPGGAAGTDFSPEAFDPPQAAAPAAAGKSPLTPESDQGKKDWVKSLTVITDVATGMRFHFDYEKHLGVITFETEPPAPVKQKVNDGGYHYKAEVAAWLFPLASGHWEEDRKHAKKVFWQGVDAMRAEMGLPPRSADRGPIPD